MNHNAIKGPRPGVTGPRTLKPGYPPQEPAAAHFDFCFCAPAQPEPAQSLEAQHPVLQEQSLHGQDVPQQQQQQSVPLAICGAGDNRTSPAVETASNSAFISKSFRVAEAHRLPLRI
ncbi:MAG: hypothetical protein KF691_14405 [Phycisphaeraceae bacterium]|nr:hypothetical protein [Phycisphaeraceae bacterium]